MTTKYRTTLYNEEYLALRAAILAGALAERQKTLRSLIDSNKGTQSADIYERELKALDSAAAAIVDAQAM